MQTLSAIIDVATQQFGAEGAAIDVDAPLSQLGVDSLGFLELLFELEDHVGVAISPDSVTGVQTLRELAARVDELIAARDATEPTTVPPTTGDAH